MVTGGDDNQTNDVQLLSHARSFFFFVLGTTRRKLIEEVEGTSVGALGFVITVTEVSEAAPDRTAPYGTTWY